MNLDMLQPLVALTIGIVSFLVVSLTRRHVNAETRLILERHQTMLDEVTRGIRAMEQRFAIHESVQNPQDVPEHWTLGDDGEIIPLEETNDNASTTTS